MTVVNVPEPQSNRIISVGIPSAQPIIVAESDMRGPPGPTGPQGPPGPALDIPILAVFQMQDDLVTITGTMPFVVPPGTYNIFGFEGGVSVSPTGQPIILDILKNGVSLFTVTPLPRILVGLLNLSTPAVPDLSVVTHGDRLTANVLQIGAPIPGSNLTLNVLANRTA